MRLPHIDQRESTILAEALFRSHLNFEKTSSIGVEDRTVWRQVEHPCPNRGDEDFLTVIRRCRSAVQRVCTDRSVLNSAAARGRNSVTSGRFADFVIQAASSSSDAHPVR
jgi:predicted RNA-binding Zn-ribbon protein involved in translation (DUF1610 family)